MEQYDERVDGYIIKSADFARPILTHLRQLIHSVSPEIKETIKWSSPHFEYKGPAFHIAAFKQHCAFNFWKRSLIEDTHQLFSNDESAGSLGKITSLADLPPDAQLLDYMRKTIELNDGQIKIAKKPIAPKAAIPVPGYFADALSAHAEAQAQFEKFSASHRREYLEWITEAKTDATRQKRVQTALEWIAEGKSRNWKYK